MSETAERIAALDDGVAISADGRFVGFESNASNLVGNDTNGGPQIFIHDRKTGLTVRVGTGVSDLPTNGELPPVAFSTNDRYAAFVSDASPTSTHDQHQQVFVRNLIAGTTKLISVSNNGTPANADSQLGGISATGNIITFNTAATNMGPKNKHSYLCDGGTCSKVFVRDVTAGTTRLVSAGRKFRP